MSLPVYDFVVIGAGIAGASIAAELAPHASVLVVEAEDQPGYHATGRSAAFWDECYGGPDIVPFTLASGDFLRENGFLKQRGALYIGREQDRPALDNFMDRYASTGASLERLEPSEVAEKAPILRPEWLDAIWEPACADIDVAGLHSHYLKRLVKAGGQVLTRSPLTSAKLVDEVWQLDCGDHKIRAKGLINAAGAWADKVAGLVGAKPLGLSPLRRTVVQLRVSPRASATLPLVLDINGQFYFKPENGRLWLSPHDEVPSAPCDAAPEEIAIAEAIDRLTQVVDIQIEQVERKWAGLRTFAPDRLPVIGRDGAIPNFFWFAGQGGWGIQTAPAAARLASHMLLDQPADAMTMGLKAETYSPLRFG